MAFDSGSIHVQQHLTDLCVAYNPREDGYVRGVFFPRKDVQHETDLIAAVNTADTLRLYDMDVSGRSDIPEVQYRTKADTTSTRWDSFGSPDSTPMEDLMAAVRTVRIKTGTSAGAKSRSGQGLIKLA